MTSIKLTNLFERDIFNAKFGRGKWKYLLSGRLCLIWRRQWKIWPNLADTLRACAICQTLLARWCVSRKKKPCAVPTEQKPAVTTACLTTHSSTCRWKTFQRAWQWCSTMSNSITPAKNRLATPKWCWRKANKNCSTNSSTHTKILSATNIKPNIQTFSQRKRLRNWRKKMLVI